MDAGSCLKGNLPRSLRSTEHFNSPRGMLTTGTLAQLVSTCWAGVTRSVACMAITQRLASAALLAPTGHSINTRLRDRVTSRSRASANAAIDSYRRIASSKTAIRVAAAASEENECSTRRVAAAEIFLATARLSTKYAA